MLPTLDAHAHLSPSRLPQELSRSGAVLAMSLSLDEAECALEQRHPLIARAVGCHPRFPRSQSGFNLQLFHALVDQTAIVGEIGLDTGSRVPFERQVDIFRQVLHVVAEKPRLVSIHSYKAMSFVLDELERCPVSIPVLHGWFGDVPQTKRAVALGCYFSIHSQVARHSKFRNHVPLERVLLESDHGYNDPPAAIPCRIEWVEYLVAQQYKLDVKELRQVVWKNFIRLVHDTNTEHFIPETLLVHSS
jgi:TatD DNase family protein